MRQPAAFPALPAAAQPAFAPLAVVAPPAPPAGPPPATPQAPETTGPPPRPKRSRIGAWIALIVVVGGLGAAGWYASHTAPASANVGDCVTQSGENSLSKVACTDPSAQFTVSGRLENRTELDAGLFACAAFPDATSAYWEGKDGETGMVLCLAPVKPAAQAPGKP